MQPPLVPLPSYWAAGSSQLQAQRWKSKRSSNAVSQVLMRSEAWEVLLVCVLMAWALMAEEKLMLVCEALGTSRTALRAKRPGSMTGWAERCFPHCTEEHTQHTAGLWHLCEEPIVPTAPSRTAGYQTCHGDLSSSTAEEWCPQRVCMRHISRKDLDERTWEGVFSWAWDVPRDPWKWVEVQQEAVKAARLCHLDIYLKVALFVSTSWWPLGHLAHLKLGYS